MGFKFDFSIFNSSARPDPSPVGDYDKYPNINVNYESSSVQNMFFSKYKCTAYMHGWIMYTCVCICVCLCVCVCVVHACVHVCCACMLARSVVVIQMITEGVTLDVVQLTLHSWSLNTFPGLQKISWRLHTWFSLYRCVIIMSQ